MIAGRVALVALVALAACRTTIHAPGLANEATATVMRAPQPSSGTLRASLWTTLPSGALPGPIGDVAALDGGEAVLLSGGVIHRWRGPDAVDPVCVAERAAASTSALLGAQADGDRFVVLGGDEAEPVVWRSDDRGAHCELVRLPSLFMRDAPRASLGHALHGAHVFVWASTGAIVRSDDAGRSWRRLPSIESVVDLAPAHDGGAVAAVVVGPRIDHARARLYSLTHDGGAWRPVEGAETLYSPVSLDVRADGSIVAAHGEGAVSLDASLAVTASRVDPAARFSAHRATIIAPAGEGRFFATTRALSFSVDAESTEPIAAIAGAREISAIDASRDGWMWTSDTRGVWRGRADAPFVEVSTHPLGGQVPVALAARGERLLVVGNGRAVAYRDSLRSTWRRMSAPSSIGAVLAAHIDEHGVLYVLGAAGLAVSDAGEFVTVPAPSLPLANGMTPVFAAMGDRWVIVSGAVFTSDDHGARWDAGFGATSLLHVGTQTMLAPSGAQRPTVVAAVARESTVLVLDQARSLWRSDDGGSTFARVASLPPSDESEMLMRSALSVIAWDGARRIAVLHRGDMQLSLDDGRTFSSTPVPFPVRWAGFVGDTIAAAGAGVTSLLPPTCHLDDASTIFVRAPDGWRPEPDPCARRASLLTPDGGSIWFVDPALNVYRASLDALVDATVRR